MKELNKNDLLNRNYTTISPSAKSLLLMKGLTNIPFARQAAEIMMSPKEYNPDYSIRDVSYWTRIVHFESRYWSIDQLLNELSIKNVLELSSGFSFRGLATIKKSGHHYIDTDLPEVIETKKNFVRTLSNNNTESKLEILPLNALDEIQLSEIVDRFPQGEIVIANEGLLMYLDNTEKEKLCRNIHKVLTERGGYWITADVYIKKQTDTINIFTDERQKEFFKQHSIEENKFDSFSSAESFFNENGFIIDKEAQSDRSKLSSLKYLIESATQEDLIKIKNRNKIQATWRLRIKK